MPCNTLFTGYVGSIVLTLYAALIMHSYVLSLVCSVLQVLALMYYLNTSALLTLASKPVYFLRAFLRGVP